MLHQSLKSCVDTVVPLDESLVTGYSKAFHVVSYGTFASMRVKQVTVGIGTTAVGNVVIQMYNKRGGLEASLLTSAITHDTSQPAASYSAMLFNTPLVVGDLLYFRVMSFTGNAKGLTITVDFM